MMEAYYPARLNVSTVDQEHAFWTDGFSREDIKRITEYGDALPSQKAEVGSPDNVDEDKRVSRVAWIPHEADTAWLFEQLCHIARELNKQYFGFDLHGISDLQYTVYTGEESGFYDWHIDKMGKGRTPRKLSLVLQLSDPQDYEGGELWLHGTRKMVLTKGYGLVHVFPAFTLHRVTPVTAGVRKSLVAWFEGPDFR